MFGNGDCFSAQQYYEEMEGAGVDGVMVARGALIKPWIFTEIKERREWDISATERLEGIRKVSQVLCSSVVLLSPPRLPSTYLITPRHLHHTSLSTYLAVWCQDHRAGISETTVQLTTHFPHDRRPHY